MQPKRHLLFWICFDTHASTTMLRWFKLFKDLVFQDYLGNWSGATGGLDVKGLGILILKLNDDT